VLHRVELFITTSRTSGSRSSCKRTGFDRAFFCNSGAEANESLLKLARHHFHMKGDKRQRIIAFDQRVPWPHDGRALDDRHAEVPRGFGEMGR